MADLHNLQKYLEGLGNPLVLRGDDPKLGAPLAALLDSMVAHTLTLDTSSGGISIAGSTLTISGASDDSWPAQGMNGVTLTLTAAKLTVTEADAVDAALSAKLPLNHQETASVSIAPSSHAGVWTVGLTMPATQVSPTDLIALGVVGALPFTIPPQLKLLDEQVTVAPGSFAIQFAPNTGEDAVYTFTLDVDDASWHLIPKVVDFAGLSLAAVITTTDWALTIIGHLAIGSVKLDLGVGVNSGPTWSAFLAPSDGSTFPGVVELAEWIADGGELGPQTSRGFSDLGFHADAFNLELERVALSFDISPAKVRSLQIVSRLTIVGLPLELVLALPDLTLSGSLASASGVKVTDMLKASGIDPAGVPSALTITAANLTADATHGEYSVEATVDGIWTTPPLQLNEISVGVAYSKALGFTGSFAAKIAIAKTEIDLSAGYGGASEGWAFAGSTPPGSTIPIGKLLDELADSFGIALVPSPIRSLTLTNLEISYKTGTGEFAFTCEADLSVDETLVAVVVTIAVQPTSEHAAQPAKDPRAVSVQGTKGYSATFTGKVSFSGHQFDIVFDVADTSTDVLVADYLHTGAPKPIELRALVADLSPTLAQGIPAGVSVELDEVKFVFLKQTSTQWAFGLRLGTTINLDELPLVGSKLPPEETLAVENLQILYSSDLLSSAQTEIINPLLPEGVAKLPEALEAGISFDAEVQLGTTRERLQAGVKPPSSNVIGPAPLAGANATPVPASSTDPVKWLDVNKQFGIFSFQRVGVGYQNNVLELALDASVALGPIAFSMQALTIGSPLTRFEPEFGLKGLALSFARPPITLGGAFLEVKETAKGKTYTSYYGEIIAGVATFSLKALGGWAPEADPAFFFIYVSIDAPLGGPPFLFVTGLAGGFGINSRLVLPTIDQVENYPLLPAQAPKEQASAAETIAHVVPELQRTFQAQAGEYWMAAGIQFTSFEMITAQAVVSVIFGVDLQIGVVGTAAMTFPTGDPSPIAYVEIDVVASFTPSTGQLAVDGKLSPASYLLGNFAKLTGGFAFYAWFSGEHQGDFVVSLGGYHPAFAKPAHYPVVPRLALAFSLGPLKVIGQSYFALTPCAFMAGVRLSATFATGPIKAWFDAGLDFLIAWAPFHYEAQAWVTIGCSVDLGLFTISVQIGANLQLWGPTFGGTALVDLDVVSFTIGFGAARAAPAPIGWKTLAESFLPPSTPATAQRVAMLASAAGQAKAPATNVITATVTAGQRAVTAAGVDWILDPDGFRIATASSIPANHAIWKTSATETAELPNALAKYRRAASAGASLALPAAVPPAMCLLLDAGAISFSETLVWAPTLNVAPMDKADVASYLTVALRKLDTHSDEFSDYITGVSVAPQLTPSNAALWGPPGATTDANAQRLIPATLTGLALSPAPRHPDRVSDVSLLSLIFEESNTTGFAYQTPAVDTRYSVSSSVDTDAETMTIEVSGAHQATLRNEHFRLSALTDRWVAGQRTAVLDELTALGFSTLASKQVKLVTMAATALTDWPSAALIGAPA